MASTPWRWIPRSSARCSPGCAGSKGRSAGSRRWWRRSGYCADVLTQVTSVQEALRGVGRAMLHNHLRHCATQAIRSGDDAQAEAMYDEIMELVYRSVR